MKQLHPFCKVWTPSWILRQAGRIGVEALVGSATLPRGSIGAHYLGLSYMCLCIGYFMPDFKMGVRKFQNTVIIERGKEGC